MKSMIKTPWLKVFPSLLRDIDDKLVIKKTTLDRRRPRSCSRVREPSRRWLRCALKAQKGNPSPDVHLDDDDENDDGGSDDNDDGNNDI